MPSTCLVEVSSSSSPPCGVLSRLEFPGEQSLPQVLALSWGSVALRQSEVGPKVRTYICQPVLGFINSGLLVPNAGLAQC